MSMPEDLSNFSLLDLFRTEVASQSAILTSGLLGLERDQDPDRHLEELMRAAHSLKGAAKIVNREAAVRVAHAMEDCFVAAQRGSVELARQRIDQLLRGVDLLGKIAQIPDAELASWTATHEGDLSSFLAALASPVPAGPPLTRGPSQTFASTSASRNEGAKQHSIRVTARNLNRLLALAGESVVASRWLDHFSTELLKFKRMHHEFVRNLSRTRDALDGSLSEAQRGFLTELQDKAAACTATLAVRVDELDSFDRRFVSLSERLYQEVLDCRMRPFADGVQGFPRMIRDAAKALGKTVHLEITGSSTPVDREILERMEAPLGHLLRNALDHGIETEEERRIAGKRGIGEIRLEARHSAGMLLIEVADNGRGLDLDAIRGAVVRKGLTTRDVAQSLTEDELLEFLFLPGFTMKDAVTDISGRGVGLDVVHSMVKEVGGRVRVSSQPGAGTRFQLQLPLTLSVLRTLSVLIGGEVYALPLSRVSSAVKVTKAEIQSIEGREHFTFRDQQVGLVTAAELLGLSANPAPGDEFPVVVVGDKAVTFGLVVDQFLGEHELVVQPLDPRLGKVKDISAAALMPDQTPALIIDVEDLLRSAESLSTGARPAHVLQSTAAAPGKERKRVLVVDDSLTVRELERKLISSRGYDVDVALDGMDGWNAVRTNRYDLVVTDVDMPRLDGIELVSLIKGDARLRTLPVMIVSYKDRTEDRRRGLQAGADYYLTKGSFHDETLLRAIVDLIGEPEE